MVKNMSGNAKKIFKMLEDGDPVKINLDLVEKAIDECLAGDGDIEEVVSLIIRSNYRLAIPLKSAEKALDMLLRVPLLDCDQWKNNVRSAFHIAKSCSEMPLQYKEQLAVFVIGSGCYKIISPTLSMLGREPLLQEKDAAVRVYLAYGQIWRAIEIAKFGVSTVVIGEMKIFCRSRNSLGSLLEKIEKIEATAPIPWPAYEP